MSKRPNQQPFERCAERPDAEASQPRPSMAEIPIRIDRSAVVTLLVMALMLFATLLGAQTNGDTQYALATTPALPTTLDDITLTARSACPGVWDAPAISGRQISLVHADTVPPMGAPCSTALPYDADFALGKLEAGAWDVLVFFREVDGALDLELSTTFTVSAVATWQTQSAAAVERCGGIIGSCDILGLEGSVSLEIDAHAGTASILASDFMVGTIEDPLFPLPATGDLSWTELDGTIDGDEIRFSGNNSLGQSAELVFTRVGEGLVLSGFYDEGCCDRYRYNFENIVLPRQSVPAPTTTLGQRFDVTIMWTDFNATRGPAIGALLQDDSAWFWFFSENNAELLVKVLDDCASSGRFWFFAGGLTNVGVDITVVDTLTSEVRTYTHPVGEDFQPILDTQAFATCN